ncbi:MAG TPA: IS1380 family transposase [Caulobacterales bacterium]|nr:IS1380 family transposase [Caulobacterales bacterium]
MSIQAALPLEYDLLGGLPIQVEAVLEQVTSDAGLLPIRELDERLGWTAGFAAQLRDARVGGAHRMAEMVRQRVFGILADYPDQNDHDTLRADGLFKIIAGRRPDDPDLASQPTLSRMENAVTAGDLLRLKAWFLEQFVASFAEPPRTLTLDIDVFDDPTHGQQQLTFFHGYYSQYQYLARAITCAENDQVVFPALLFGTAHATLGADVDLQMIVARLRAAWPDVRIHLRADSGYATPAFFAACQQLDIDYTIGIGMNAVLKRESEATLEAAVSAWETTHEPQRRFTALEYQSGSWDAPRWTIVKCEAHAQGTNRRAVVTNRRGARVLPQGAYDEYADRGESENRNKELKCELKADRLSDHRYMANSFRLALHTLAYNLLVRVRRLVADPPAPPRAENELPPEARVGREKRKAFNRRRQADPLGEGHASTWRTQLIKVAARIIASTRRVRVLLSAAWPFWDHLAKVTQAVRAFRSAASGETPPALDSG